MTIYILFLIFVGIAVGLGWFFISEDHGQKEPLAALWLALGLGLLSTVPAFFLENELLHIKPAGLPPEQLGGLVGTTLGVGIIEEICKFAPLAFFIYKKRYFNEHTDGVIYFGLAGLGFGLPENILYTIEYGSEAGWSRLVLTPVFHVAITALVGYFLIRGKIIGRSPAWVLLPLVVAAVIHAAYNFGLMSMRPHLVLASTLLTLTLSGALFVLFILARQKDQKHGLSAVGSNKFCRNCGNPNPHRYLYCVKCGKKA